MQTLEQHLRALIVWFDLEQVGLLARERPEHTATHPQSHGRNRQRAALQPILDEMQQSISIASRFAQIEAFDGGRPMQVLESELEARDLRLSPLELCTELVEELLDGLDENCAVDAFLAELGNRAPGPRRLELGTQIDAATERSIELEQIGTPDSTRETVSRQPRTIADGTEAEVQK